MEPLTEYCGTNEKISSDMCSVKKNRLKKAKKSFLKQKKKAHKQKKKAKRLKQELKLERQLNKERAQRYQSEAKLKCAFLLLQTMSGGKRIPLPDLLGDYQPDDDGRSNL